MKFIIYFLLLRKYIAYVVLLLLMPGALVLRKSALLSIYFFKLYTIRVPKYKTQSVFSHIERRAEKKRGSKYNM